MLRSTIHLLKLSLSLFSPKATLRTQNTDFAPKPPLSMSGHPKRGVPFFLKGGEALIRGSFRTGASFPLLNTMTAFLKMLKTS